MFAGKKKILTGLIEKHPLTADQLAQLFTLSDTYIVPWQQHNVKRCALVLYNPEGRQKGFDAVKEANLMESHLQKARFTTRKIEWTDALALRNIIMSETDDFINGGVSMLFIVIMTHGRVGMLIGSNNTKMPITDVLSILNEKIPSRIPLVSKIWLCWDSPSVLPFAVISSYENPFIDFFLSLFCEFNF